MQIIKFMTTHGVAEVVVANTNSCSAILNMLEKSGVDFKVYYAGGYLRQEETKFGGFMRWLAEDQKFENRL